jgi:hypothetical protein
VPSGHREFSVLAVAHRWLAANTQLSLHLSAFLDCTRFAFFLSANLEQFRLSNIVRAYLKSKFQDYEEVVDRAEVISAFDDLALTCPWPVDPGRPRKESQETFYLYDPRVRSLARQGHSQFDHFSTAENTFDLSCNNFNQNITGLRLLTQDTAQLELLKKITLTFCDGSEKTVSTQVGSHNTTHQLELGTEARPRHARLLSGPWVADPLEALLSLSFFLSDGEVLGFRGQTFSLDRSAGASLQISLFGPSSGGNRFLTTSLPVYTRGTLGSLSSAPGCAVSWQVGRPVRQRPGHNSVRRLHHLQHQVQILLAL